MINLSNLSHFQWIKIFVIDKYMTNGVTIMSMYNQDIICKIKMKKS